MRVCVCVCACAREWLRGRVEESEGNGGEGGAMASTSNTEKRGRSTEENIARGVQSGNTSGGGNRSEKTSLVEYTKTIVRLLRSRCERSQMASAEDRVFEVSELVHDAAGQPDLGTVDADDRKKMYRRFYDVIKVLAACRIIFFPGVDNVSRATKFTIAGAHIQNRRAQGKGEGERGEREVRESLLRHSFVHPTSYMLVIGASTSNINTGVSVYSYGVFHLTYEIPAPNETVRMCVYVCMQTVVI